MCVCILYVGCIFIYLYRAAATRQSEQKHEAEQVTHFTWRVSQWFTALLTLTSSAGHRNTENTVNTVNTENTENTVNTVSCTNSEADLRSVPQLRLSHTLLKSFLQSQKLFNLSSLYRTWLYETLTIFCNNLQKSHVFVNRYWINADIPLCWCRFRHRSPDPDGQI